MAAPKEMSQGKRDEMSMKDTKSQIAAQRKENKEADKNVDSLIKNGSRREAHARIASSLPRHPPVTSRAASVGMAGHDGHGALLRGRARTTASAP